MPEEYGLFDFPSGTNACIAVISYTGYDMEDAMILSKSSYEVKKYNFATKFLNHQKK
jgi:DNA-directed RNA polymerase beta subunit